MIERTTPTTQSHPDDASQLDPESRAWLEALRSDGARYDKAIMRLHALLLTEARYQVRRRTASLAHPSGRDLDDLAMQAADDALVAILAKLDRFRGDARFTTWARRFAELEVPGKIRRRLGHARETPTETEMFQLRPAGDEDAQAVSEAVDLADRLGELIVEELTSHQREVLVALAIDGINPKDLAARIDSSPGALYKTLHDARRKLKHGLTGRERDDHQGSRRSSSTTDRTEARRLAQRMLVCAEV
jgi:RNA polymerase sigma-70 factor (ECF subfamily)